MNKHYFPLSLITLLQCLFRIKHITARIFAREQPRVFRGAHKQNGQPFWHWVVFVREDSGCYVLDSKQALKQHRRTDFGRMQPKWYLKVNH